MRAGAKMAYFPSYRHLIFRQTALPRKLGTGLVRRLRWWGWEILYIFVGARTTSVKECLDADDREPLLQNQNGYYLVRSQRRSYFILAVLRYLLRLFFDIL